MNFPSKEALVKFIADKETWHLQGPDILFKNEEVKDFADQIPSHELISKTLSYAHELERIV